MVDLANIAFLQKDESQIDLAFIKSEKYGCFSEKTFCLTFER